MKLLKAFSSLAILIGPQPDLGFRNLAIAQEEASAVLAFDIPAQPLADALAAFEEQTGMNVTFNKAIVRGKTNRPIHGGYQPEAALRSMLRDTDLTFSPLPSGEIEIIITPQPTRYDCPHTTACGDNPQIHNH